MTRPNVLVFLAVLALALITACQQQPQIVLTLRPTITPSVVPSATLQATAESTGDGQAAATASGTAPAGSSTPASPMSAATSEATAAPAASPTPAPTVGAFAAPRSFARQPITVSPDGEIVIGLAAALSGEGLAPLGIDIRRGAELALADRPTVEVDGVTFRVVLDSQDDLCSADGGQAVANRFAADEDVIGVVGPMCSSACRAAAPIFDTASFTTISPSCTAADLSTSGFASFNRAVASDALQGIVAAEFIFRPADEGGLGVTRIATIHDGSPYGEGLVNVLSARFIELGGEVVANEVVNVGDTDFRGLLEDISEEEPELVYFAGFPAEAARLADQRADARLEDALFMGADGIRTQEFIELAGDAAAGAYASTSIAADSEALDTFLERYVEAYGEEPPAPFHANAYDATNILLNAIEATGTVDADGNLALDRAAIRDYVRGITDYPGLTGLLNADGSGEMAAGQFGISLVRDGQFVEVAVGSIVAGDVVISRTDG